MVQNTYPSALDIAGIERRVERVHYEESLRVLMSYLDVRTEVVRGLNSQGHGGDVEREGSGLF